MIEQACALESKSLGFESYLYYLPAVVTLGNLLNLSDPLFYSSSTEGGVKGERVIIVISKYCLNEIVFAKVLNRVPGT